MRPPKGAGTVGAVAWVVGALAVLVASPAAALQIRPLEPMRWDRPHGGGVEVSVGAGYYAGQRASLAGTRGRLFELGVLGASWRLGRVVLAYRGTAVRLFSDDSVYAPPVADARPFDGRRRVDAGEHRLATTLLLTEGPSLAAAVRFGVKLPTSDNAQGLGRDQTDFYATVGARWRRGPVGLRAEAGVGVLGTRDLHNEQVDPLLYAVGGWWGRDGLRVVAEALGQHDPRATGALRGTENLGEARLGIDVGSERSVRLFLVRGYTSHSPEIGVSLETRLAF